MPEHEYVLGTNDAELARLGYQHQVWSAQTAAAWERGGFGRGSRLLDVGCGPGHGTFAMADLVGPDGHVLAVDVSARFVGWLAAEARRRGVLQVETRVEDLAELSAEPGSLDGAFARWVLCFVPDPRRVVANVARALRPGGTFVVMDYCHYEGFSVAPRSEAIDRVIAAVARSFRAAGGDPDVGMSVPRMMEEAGLAVREVRPLVRAARPGTALWEWPATFFANYLPMLVAAGGITDEDRLAFERDWQQRAASPGSFLLTPPMVEVVGVKG